ncbi:hypothetical protein CPB85DRAFT_1331554 [Mucidula mucida]|nr:hypothetical protein CPB85DRAFT_1331554 [Mucidula mucida]
MRGDLNVVRTAQATMRGDLNVVRTTQANMQTNQTGMQTTLADVRTSQRGMERTLADVQTTLAEHGATLDDHGTKLGLLTRICAQSSNRLRGPGTSIAFCIVPFLDDSLPTVPIPDPNGGPQPVRPALPAILNVHAIRSMSGANLRLYIQGYYGPDQNVPHMLQARRALVADAVGCTVEL